MQYVNVDSGSKKTDILGQALLGFLNDLDLVFIQWEDKYSRWVCYTKQDQISAHIETPLVDPTDPDSPET